MPLPNAKTPPHPIPTPDISPLARSLASQAEAQFTDLSKARGLDGSTFEALVGRADALNDILRSWGLTDQARETVTSHRAVLHAVAALLNDPHAKVIAPSNDRIYAAVLDITELSPIVRTLGSTQSGREAVRRHLEEPDAAAAHADRLALSFAAICKRGGLSITPPAAPGAAFGIDIDGWRIAAAPAVPLTASELTASLLRALAELRACKRPGLVLLEAGPLLDFKPIRVAEDAVATGLMNERLEAFMLSTRPAVLEAIGDDHAFGLVVHATLPATNAVSNRMLFAECFRAVNLCDADDPRADGFRTIVDAMTR